jgi:hypothetical protein
LCCLVGLLWSSVAVPLDEPGAVGPLLGGAAAAVPRFRQLERRKHITGVAVVAVACELAGFL